MTGLRHPILGACALPALMMLAAAPSAVAAVALKTVSAPLTEALGFTGTEQGSFRFRRAKGK